MGTCLSAQRPSCTEPTSSTHSSPKALLTRAPSSPTQDHGPAAAPTCTSTSTCLLPTREAYGDAVQRTGAAAAITAAIETPLTLDPTAQTAEPQGTTAPADASSAAEDAAAASGTAEWRPTATATVTLQPTTPGKLKIAPQTVSAQALDVSRQSFIPLTLTWAAAERECLRLKQVLRKERAGRHAATGALAASGQLAADQACQLSAQQERLSALEDTLRGRDETLAAAVAQAACLRIELDERRGRDLEIESQLRAYQAQLAEQECQVSAAQAQRAEHDCQLRAFQAQRAEQDRQISALQAQLAEQDRQLSASQAQLAQQEARLGLLPKTMARATELAGQLAAAERATADAKAKLEKEQRKGMRLAWLVRKTEHFAETLEALHDDLPHLSEDDMTTVGVLGKGGFARVDRMSVAHADGSTEEVAVKVVLPLQQPAAAADTSSATTEASSDASSAASSADDSETDSGASSAASSAGDSAPAVACSIASAACSSSSDEDEDADSDSDGDEEDGSDSDEDEEWMGLSEDALQQSVKSRALRLEAAVLTKLRGLPCILSAQAWQGRGRSGLVLPLAQGGSLKELLWPVPGDKSVFVPQDREQVLRIAGGLCTALLAAHDNGVAHLDVKADNVLLDADLNVQLADWGTAAPLSFTAAQWRARGIIGSAGLIFPKVLYNPANGGARADVYAAGALSYGLLTGRDYARECSQQYRALPKATRMAIKSEAANRCDALGYSGEPTIAELLMVAQLHGHVHAEQVGQNLQLLGGACMPEPLAPLMYWTQQALCMETWRDCEVSLHHMKSAIVESWQRLHAVA